MPTVEEVMLAAPVIPVVVVDGVSDGVELARALVKGGLPSIEVTLRTPNAMEAIKAIADDVEGALVGAGTVITPDQIAAVEKAGGTFMVSPGASGKLLDAAEHSKLPLLPGVATASELMAAGERGYTHVKFFPAEQAGGAPYLKSLSGPLPQFRFCPTGGVSLANAGDYLSLPNVLCVGGSWVCPGELVRDRKWTEIEKLASNAAGLKR